ncbi:MAG: hypothetical protein ACRDBQ_18995 [Shewanella sp.]
MTVSLTLKHFVPKEKLSRPLMEKSGILFAEIETIRENIKPNCGLNPAATYMSGLLRAVDIAAFYVDPVKMNIDLLSRALGESHAYVEMFPDTIVSVGECHYNFSHVYASIIRNPVIDKMGGVCVRAYLCGAMKAIIAVIEDSKITDPNITKYVGMIKTLFVDLVPRESDRSRHTKEFLRECEEFLKGDVSTNRLLSLYNKADSWRSIATF